MIELAESMKILEAFKVEDFLHCDRIQINNHKAFIIWTVEELEIWKFIAIMSKRSWIF